MAILFRPYSMHYSDTFVWLKFDHRIAIPCGLYYAFECGGKYGEIDVEGRAFQRNAHVSYRAAQRLWEQRGSDQLSAIVSLINLLKFYYDRVGYLKDVVLARVLDEATAASLNSIIHSNNAIVISILKDDSTFIQELFARLRSPTTSAESKKNLGCYMSLELILPLDSSSAVRTSTTSSVFFIPPMDSSRLVTQLSEADIISLDLLAFLPLPRVSFYSTCSSTSFTIFLDTTEP
ncbi:hypothetical protein GOBAR_AA13339 [Gossypium barbadense]|uniref:Serine/threonine-protein phosphatase 4 regulatory subunit 3-like central domain-containing protein n=1 Tax=Gossypium barbadense TaxID=3634 RepID=A0A2P5XVC6_GOSBA|nr:hypothetical protein GOBAR_AA13339 [Gossypium barbadense]